MGKLLRFCLIAVFFLLFTGTFVVYAKGVRIDPADLFESHVQIDEATIIRGYTLASTDDFFRIGVPPESFLQDIDVHTKIYSYVPEGSFMYVKYPEYTLKQVIPDGTFIVGSIYEFDIETAAGDEPLRPMWLWSQYFDESVYTKSFYFLNEETNEWEKIHSNDHQDTGILTAEIQKKHGTIAILGEKAEVGIASWYKFRGCLCAAHRDYPDGTKLEVKNTYNNKTVVVTVNDYGPMEWTGRIIDLDSVAFKELAPLGAGVIDVEVRKIEDMNEDKNIQTE